VGEGLNGTGVFGSGGGSNSKGVEGSGFAYDFYASGSGIDYGTSSSIRWKKNIIEIDNALEKILSVRGVYFDWDEEHGGDHDIGFIAEEVGEHIPEIVAYEEGGIYATGLDYGAITPVLVQAVKELKAENETVKSENEQLREKLTALTDRQEALENMFLAISTTLTKEKLVKLDQLNSDEVQKTIQ
jgi:hypothetical protein